MAAGTAEHFELIVIGGGSGGSATAKRSAEYLGPGKVCIIERGHTYTAGGVRQGAGFGGTCVNVGCVPKKLMFNCAQQREAIHGSVAVAGGLGFSVPESAAQFDWAGVKARRDAYVQRLTKNYKSGWSKAGCEVVHGFATFVSPTEVAVRVDEAAGGGTRTLTAPKILIACGGKPTTLPIPGAELGITSDGFFDLEAQPRSAVVLGAGYIAVEMAGILHGLGTETHLCFRGETVLRRGFDTFVVETLMEHMAAHGPKLHPGRTPAKIELEGTTGLKRVTFEDGSSEVAECVLFATGRTPVTGLLELDKAGVATDQRGFIKVDQNEATSAAGIYAVGDATTTGFELTPVAIAAGRRLADRLFGGEPSTGIGACFGHESKDGLNGTVYDTIATVVFSHPPIGTIGLTQAQAETEFGEAMIKTKYSRFPSMFYAFNDDGAKVKTGLKLVLLLPEERVVGLHCIGPYSDEMLQGFAVAVRMGATRMDFEASVAIHPTIGEEFVTFSNWGQKFDKDPIGKEVGKAKPYVPPYLQEKPTLATQLLEAQIRGCFAGTLIGMLTAVTIWRQLKRPF